MKIVALSFGRFQARNHEFTQLALDAAAELGVETEHIDMVRRTILPCQRCGLCHDAVEQGSAFPDCVIRDDFQHVRDRLLEADGILMSVPVYCGMPDGEYINLMDRMYSVRYDWLLSQERRRRERIPAAGPVSAPGVRRDAGTVVAPLEKRLLKVRPIAYITIAGADDFEWEQMGMMQMKLFGQMIGARCTDVMRFSSREEDQTAPYFVNGFARVKELGRNLARALGKPRGEIPYCGDDAGVCPVCHERMVTFTGGDKVRCTFCGTEGSFRIEDGDLRLSFDPFACEFSRFS